MYRSNRLPILTEEISQQLTMLFDFPFCSSSLVRSNGLPIEYQMNQRGKEGSEEKRMRCDQHDLIETRKNDNQIHIDIPLAIYLKHPWTHYLQPLLLRLFSLRPPTSISIVPSAPTCSTTKPFNVGSSLPTPLHSWSHAPLWFQWGFILLQKTRNGLTYNFLQ